MRNTLLLSVVLLCGCIGSGGSTGPGEAVNVTGTWTGTLKIAFGSDSISAPVQFELNHEPNSDELTGVVSASVVGDVVISEESGVKSRVVTIVTQYDETGTDDCHQYTQTWEFLSLVTEMRLTKLTGTLCVGDGNGGHESLRVITGGRGNVAR
jgi:hypothetical protein